MPLIFRGTVCPSGQIPATCELFQSRCDLSKPAPVVSSVFIIAVPHTSAVRDPDSRYRWSRSKHANSDDVACEDAASNREKVKEIPPCRLPA